MLRTLTVFLSALLAWLATLWYWLRPDFAGRSLPEIIGIHATPPLVILLLWGGWRLFRWLREKRVAAATAEKEAAAEAERQTALAEVKARQADELRRQQQGCDCRAVAMMQLIQAPDAQPVFGLTADDVEIARDETVADADPDAPILDHLLPGIAGALRSLYARCPAASVFPIYVLPPAETVGEEVFACLRRVRAELAQELGLQERLAAEFNRTLFLPMADSVANSVAGLFDSAPDLPGLVILAFDSAWLRALRQDNEIGEDDPRLVEQLKWLGEPSQGVFALLFTHPELPAMLDFAAGVETDHDAMTPYWERGLSSSGHQCLLAALTIEERGALRELPVLARLHRAAYAQFDGQRRHTTAMVRQVQALLERAQINAALAVSPLAPGEAEDHGAAAAPECGWLVHNAGGVDRAGSRLATLGVALFNLGLPVDPIDTGTNLVVHGGDYGQARGVALLALTVARAAKERMAALGAEFSGDDGLALFFAVPPGDPA